MKNLIVFLSLWSDDQDMKTMEVLKIRHAGGTDQKSCSFGPAEALAKNDVNRRLLIYFF